MSRVLVIEDDDGIRENILELLEMEGFEPIGAPDGEGGVSAALARSPHLIICDIAMPGIDGFEVFEILSSKPATAVIPFIFLSARAERADVRRGMTLGAADYLTKPFTRVELLDSIRARLRRRQALQSDDDGAPAVPAPPDAMVVVDPAMQRLFAEVERFAKGAISVLILGETGVGKEVVAEHIHARSGRSGPFVALNCAALTENLIESELFGHERGAFTGADRSKQGLFESAMGGTMFLDEVGELPASTQVKLLRVLEARKVRRVGGRTDHPIDVRFISATNRPIETDVSEGGFRQDLFFRLNGFTLHVPPLRERRADIEPLARAFITASCAAVGRSNPPALSDDALAVLNVYEWPGNIRELRNVIERAVLLCDGRSLGAAHLPPNLAGASVPSDSDPRRKLLKELEDVERQRVVDALARAGGNQTRAAELLGISRRTLVTRMGEYDLPRPRKK